MAARVPAAQPRAAAVYGENHEICGRTGTLCVLWRPQILGSAGVQARMVRSSFSRLVRLRAAARGGRTGAYTRCRPMGFSSTVTVVDRPSSPGSRGTVTDTCTSGRARTPNLSRQIVRAQGRERVCQAV